MAIHKGIGIKEGETDFTFMENMPYESPVAVCRPIGSPYLYIIGQWGESLDPMYQDHRYVSIWQYEIETASVLEIATAELPTLDAGIDYRNLFILEGKPSDLGDFTLLLLKGSGSFSTNFTYKYIAVSGSYPTFSLNELAGVDVTIVDGRRAEYVLKQTAPEDPPIALTTGESDEGSGFNPALLAINGTTVSTAFTAPAGYTFRLDLLKSSAYSVMFILSDNEPEPTKYLYEYNLDDGAVEIGTLAEVGLPDGIQQFIYCDGTYYFACPYADETGGLYGRTDTDSFELLTPEGYWGTLGAEVGFYAHGSTIYYLQLDYSVTGTETGWPALIMGKLDSEFMPIEIGPLMKGTDRIFFEGTLPQKFTIPPYIPA